MKRPQIAKKRPAETATGVAGSIAALLVLAFDIDNPAVVAPLVVVIGFVPAAITWLVNTIRGEAEE